MKINRFKNVFQKPVWFFMPLLCFVMSACSDMWDEHYDSSKMNSGNSLLVTLKKDSTLTIFAKMLQIAQLETRITGGEAFTIWAPNNAALADYKYLLNSPALTTTDSVSIALVVKNHIGRYYASTSQITSVGVNEAMINGKYIMFQKVGDSFTFGGMALDLARSNKVCSNGVLHVINGAIPFEKNTWETIKLNPEYSSIYNYIYSFDSTYIDQARSIKIGINSQGLSVYDTVFIFSNKLFKKIGFINKEDSSFTSILPTNIAYNTAYDTYKTYYKSNGGISANYNSDSITMSNTNYAIVKNLFYRGIVDITSSDSLVSTSGTAIHDRSSLFAGCTKIPVSNGVVYKTDKLNFNLLETLLSPVTLETEKLRYGTSLDYDALVLNATVKINQYANLISGVSGGYVLIEPTSLTSKPYVEITMKGVLSGNYDLYCTVVPANAEDTTNVNEQTILDFSLGYFSGKTWKTKTITTGIITDKTNVQEILVGSNVSIPFFDSKASLIIQVNVPSSQAALYSRSVRIDKIRLVPKLQ
jgi:uncharacterized surface protein with fasciclin (FAS1) repeats